MARQNPDHSALIDLDVLTRSPAADVVVCDDHRPTETQHLAFEVPHVVAPLAAVAAPRARRTFPRWAAAIAALLLTSGVALAAMVVAVTAEPEDDGAVAAMSEGPEIALREAVAETAQPEKPDSMAQPAIPVSETGPPTPPVEAAVPDAADPGEAAPAPKRAMPRPETKRPRVRRPKVRTPPSRVAVNRNQDEDVPPAKAAVTPSGGSATPDAVAVARPTETAGDEVDEMLRRLDEPAGEPVPPRVVEVPAPLPLRLDRSQVMRSIRPILGRISACPGSGTYNARITVAPAGRVRSLDITGPDAAGRLCVERHVRGLRFPRFGGDPMTLSLPFKT